MPLGIGVQLRDGGPQVEFGLPDLESRTQIFQIHTRTMNVERDIRFELLARLCPNATGADIRSVCTEAGMFAIRSRCAAPPPPPAPPPRAPRLHRPPSLVRAYVHASGPRRSLRTCFRVVGCAGLRSVLLCLQRERVARLHANYSSPAF